MEESESKVTQETKLPEVETKSDDLITRVSQVEEKKEEGKFNINELDGEIEKISDPNLKKQFSDFKKSLLRGENQKYQEIATLRKQYEQRLAEVSNWTPERLKQEINKPDFVQSANEVLQKDKSDDYSALSESEKLKIKQAEDTAKNAQAQLYQLQKTQIHTKLKSKYANYDPDIVDTNISQLLKGQVKDEEFLEAIHKARDYENAVKRAYELGLIDKKSRDMEKVTGMTYSEGINMQTPSVIEKQKGETNEAFMRRSYQEHSKKK